MATQLLTLLPAPRRMYVHSGVSTADTTRVVPRIDPLLVPHPQGYRLTIAPARIDLVAHDPAGAFYAKMTLAQIVRQCAPSTPGQEARANLPCLVIDDYPDFPFRGFMLDISRDKVPTMDTLRGLVDLLASLKINQFQLYTEHTFAYRNHRMVWEQASPMTAEEIRELDAYCRARFVELVPNQNSFGHMNRWLMHKPYGHLAESEQGTEFTNNQPFTLCPGDPGSIALMDELFEELLPNFSSRQFNVGCDETFDLGQGRSKEECARRGNGRVYLDFLLKIYKLVHRSGHTMQFWGDIILNHPELVAELPRDIIALEWGYQADFPFAKHSRCLAEVGVAFYVCPGTSSWMSISGRVTNAVDNLRLAAEHGLAHGAVGYLNTDWGDYGHWQQLPISYPGLAYGAGVGWCAAANRDLNLARALDLHVFHDTAGVLGGLAVDLGNAYLKTGVVRFRRTIFADLMQKDPTVSLKEKQFADLSATGLQAAAAHVDDAMGRLPRARSSRPDAALLGDEFRLTAALVRHACTLGQARLAADGAVPSALPAAARAALATDLGPLQAEYRRLWLTRNRPGGLSDSAGRMERLLQMYR